MDIDNRQVYSPEVLDTENEIHIKANLIPVSQRYEGSDLLPLTDIQEACLIGESGLYDFNGRPNNVFLEIKIKNLSISKESLQSKIENSLNRMIAANEALRAVILEDGAQKITDETPHFKIEIIDIKKETPNNAGDILKSAKQKLKEGRNPTNRSPLLYMIGYQVDKRTAVLMIQISSLIIGKSSVPRFVYEFIRLIIDPTYNKGVVKSDYKESVLSIDAIRAHQLLIHRQNNSPMDMDAAPYSPQMPLKHWVEPSKDFHFIEIDSVLLDSQSWKKFKHFSIQNNVSPLAVLIAIYTASVANWSFNSRFLIGTINNRSSNLWQSGPLGNFDQLTLLDIDLLSGNILSIAQNIELQLNDKGPSELSGFETVRELNRLKHRSPFPLLPILFLSDIETDYSSLIETIYSQVENNAKQHKRQMTFEVKEETTYASQTLLSPTVYIQNGQLKCLWSGRPNAFNGKIFYAIMEFFKKRVNMLALDSEYLNSSWHVEYPDSDKNQYEANPKEKFNINHPYVTRTLGIRRLNSLKTLDSEIGELTLKKLTLNLIYELISRNVKQDDKIIIDDSFDRELLPVLDALFFIGATAAPANLNNYFDIISQLSDVKLIICKNCSDEKIVKLSDKIECIDTINLKNWDQFTIGEWNEYIKNQSFDEYVKLGTKMSLSESFLIESEARRDKIAIKSPYAYVTYSDLRISSANVAKYFIDNGIQKTDYLIIDSQITWEIIPIALAALFIGSKIIITNTSEDFRYILNKYPIKAMICSHSQALLFQQNFPLPIIDISTLKYSENFTIDDIDGYLNRSSDSEVIFYKTQKNASQVFSLDEKSLKKEILNFTSEHQINENDNLALMNSYDSPLWLIDVFSILLTGGSIVIPQKGSSANLSKTMEFEKISVWNHFSFHLEEIENLESLASLRLIILRNNRIDKAFLSSLKETLPNAVIQHVWLPSSLSLWALKEEAVKVEDYRDTLFHDFLGGQKIKILNSSMEKCPELSIGRAYILREKYREDNNQIQLEEEIIPTNFIGRYVDNGIEILGDDTPLHIQMACDNITVNTVEEICETYPDVNLAVACLMESSDKLSVFLVTDNKKQIDPAKFKLFLQERLPFYCIPKYVIQIDSLPLTFEGDINMGSLMDILENHDLDNFDFDSRDIKESKLNEYWKDILNRKQFENPNIYTNEHRDTVSDRQKTELELIKYWKDLLDEQSKELKLIEYWSELLDISEIDRRDNFFDLGGDSLKAAKFFELINRDFSNSSLTSARFFEEPTIQAISKYL